MHCYPYISKFPISVFQQSLTLLRQLSSHNRFPTKKIFANKKRSLLWKAHSIANGQTYTPFLVDAPSKPFHSIYCNQCSVRKETLNTRNLCNHMTTLIYQRIITLMADKYEKLGPQFIKNMKSIWTPAQKYRKLQKKWLRRTTILI